MDVYQIIGGSAGVVIILGALAAALRLAWRFVRRLVTFLDQWEGPPSIPARIEAIEKRVNGRD